MSALNSFEICNMQDKLYVLTNSINYDIQNHLTYIRRLTRRSLSSSIPTFEQMVLFLPIKWTKKTSI